MKNRIEERRKVQGMTQQQLAALLGVSRQTIISLESGKYNPSILLAHKIAQTFGVHIEDIFLFEEDEALSSRSRRSSVFFILFSARYCFLSGC